MDRVIKIFYFTLTKKNILFLAILFFVALGLLLPTSSAEAFLGPLAWLFMGAIAWMVMAFVLSLTNILLWFASIILMWSLDPWFIRVPYTSGGIVDIGWPVVRDLANMGIVLALVFIGLATALRIKEYQAQKTLPRLIGVALLINFTPVILGVIVDASNIVMNFFLAELTGGEALFRQFQALGSMISSELGGMKWLNPLQHWTLTFKIIIMAIFNIFAAVIFLLFAFLFILRRIAIWILVILSPIAFVAYIFPSTRGFFNMWLNQFVQWSIIGIAAAFFLWLGEQMIILAAAGGFVSEVPGVAGGFLQEPITDIISGIAPYFIALLFLLIGFFVALSTSAMGASGIIAIGRKVPAWAGAQTAQQTLGRFFAGEHAKRTKGEETWLKRLEERGMGAPPIKKTYQEFKEAKGVGKVVKGAGLVLGVAALPASYATRFGIRAGVEYGAKQAASQEGLAREYEKIWKEDPGRARNLFEMLGPLQSLEKNAHILAAARARGGKGLAQFGEEEIKERIGSISRIQPKRIEDIVKHQQDLIDDKKIGQLIQKSIVPKKWDDEDVKTLIKAGVEPAQAIRKAAFKKVADALKKEDISNLTRKTVEHPEFQEQIARFKSWNFIRALGEEQGLDYLDKLQGKAQEIGIEEIAKTNPTFLRAPYTPGGQMFLHNWEQEGKEIKDRSRINELIRKAPRTLLSETEIEKIIKTQKEKDDTDKPAPEETPPGVPPSGAPPPPKGRPRFGGETPPPSPPTRRPRRPRFE